MNLTNGGKKESFCYKNHDHAIFITSLPYIAKRHIQSHCVFFGITHKTSN